MSEAKEHNIKIVEQLHDKVAVLEAVGDDNITHILYELRELINKIR